MRMTAVLIGAALMLSAHSYADQQTQTAPSTRPIIFCAEPTFDFGKILRGKPVEHTFVIENKGDAPLRILSVQPSCSCTTAPVAQDSIEPGKRTEIKARFDSAQFEGFVEKTVKVASDDPENPQFFLVITGTVYKAYEVVPDQIILERVNKNMDFETRVVLRGAEGRKPIVSSVAVDGDSAFEARFMKTEDEYTIFLKLKPGAEPHAVDGEIVVTLDDPELPTLGIPFQGQILPDVTCFPQKLVFGDLKPKDTFPRRVLIVISNPKVAIESVSIEPPIFATTLNEREWPAGTRAGPRAELLTGSNGFDVQIVVKEDAPAGEVKGNVVIKTTSKDQPVITVPITGKIVTQ
ncbi:MAG: DUF1573 domain-containing protein [Acidobacteriota bacterium]